ncbi:MAG: hypothetical protein H0W09_06050, partial [Solirubrobacterales bacterium]|nr:hypothetical protein [Solirubrobacterales bacterium]
MRGLHISQLGSAEQLPGSTRFAWRDGERLIVFGRGELGRAGSLLDEEGWRDFELVTTARALEGAPGDLIAAARAIHELGSGEVPALAARICGRREARDLVALGGGRAIDTAKAVA